MLTAARETLMSWGAVELPPYPGILQSGWLHPDLFSRQISGKDGQFFTMQPVIEGGCGCRRKGGAVGTLVWWRRPFSAAWISRLPELLAALQPGGDTPATSGFETIGRSFQPGVWGEGGCIWDILWKGCRIGEIRVMSQVTGVRADPPAGVAVLNLESIAAVWNGDPSLESVSWDGTVMTSDIAAWRYSGICFDSGGETPLRSAQARWERIRTAGEAALAGNRWLDAYIPLLDGTALLSEAAVAGPALDGFRQACEGVLKTMCRRLVQIVPRPDSPAPAPRGVKEAVLR